MRKALFLLAVLSFAIGAASAQEITQGSLYAASKKGKELGACPLKSTSVQTDISGFIARVRELQIEKQALEVMDYCGQLSKDFARFKTDFDVIGKHIGNAQGKYNESQRWLERFEDRLERATDEVESTTIEPGEQLRAIDAA